MIIQTPRLKLVPASAELIRMEMNEHEELSRQLKAFVPINWPPESVRDVLEFFAKGLDARPEIDGWRVWYWLAKVAPNAERVLVGSGGFTGLPDAKGSVEVGYGTLEDYQGLGYATEAVKGMVEWAFAQPNVFRVIAEAAQDNPASIRVLKKSGFVLVGAGSEAGLNRYEQQRQQF